MKISNQLEPSIILNNRYIKAIKRDIFLFCCLISFPVFLFQFLFCHLLERKDKKFKRDIIVLISFLILFVSISFLVNIGKKISLTGFRTYRSKLFPFRCDPIFKGCKTTKKQKTAASPKTTSTAIHYYIFSVFFTVISEFI